MSTQTIEILTYSPPGFGGSQSPCAFADIVENPLLAGDILIACVNSCSLWVVLQELDAANRLDLVDRCDVEEMARTRVANTGADGFRRYCDVPLLSPDRARLATLAVDISSKFK
jgi:hypothetical protein